MKSLIKTLLRESLINEGVISQSQLNSLEKELDSLFATVGIDIEFTRHFFERVNDARNGRDITVDELMRKKNFMSDTPVLPVGSKNKLINEPRKDKFKKYKLPNGVIVRYYVESNKFETIEGEPIDIDSIFDSLPEEMQNMVMIKMDESFNVIEGLVDEDYPSSWNIDEFKTIKSFSGRKKYCEEHLQRISSGSSRIVYKIDNEKVLKLAKNKKGLAQNSVEAEYSQYGDLSDILAKIYNADDNNLWVEMELARRVNKNDFKRITGYNFEDFANAVHNYGVDSGNGRGYKHTIDKEIVADMWEDEFVYSIFGYIGDYGVPAGDLTRLSTYGIVKGDGDERIVIIDYGLSSDVYDSYYS